MNIGPILSELSPAKKCVRNSVHFCSFVSLLPIFCDIFLSVSWIVNIEKFIRLLWDTWCCLIAVHRLFRRQIKVICCSSVSLFLCEDGIWKTIKITLNSHWSNSKRKLRTSESEFQKGSSKITQNREKLLRILKHCEYFRKIQTNIQISYLFLKNSAIDF